MRSFLKMKHTFLFFFKQPVNELTVAPQLIPFSFGQGTMTSGQPITVQCIVVDGDLPMTLRWMFHGGELSTQMGVTTFRLNPRVSLLSIDAVAAAHAGDYTCTAQNAAGTAHQSAALLVQGQLPGISNHFY